MKARPGVVLGSFAVTLRSRLLFSALLLSLATTFVLSLVLRSAWRAAEAARFDEEFHGAVDELSRELASAGRDIQQVLAPLCAHDPILDSALVGLESNTLSSRIVSLRARIPELGRSLGLSELALIASDGSILAGGATVQEEGDALAAHVLKVAQKPRFVAQPPQAFEAACLRQSGRLWVALLGTSHLLPKLERAGRAHGLDLSLSASAELSSDPMTLTAQVTLPSLAGATLVATRSRQPLRAQLRDLDVEVASAALLTVLGGLLMALLLSKGLARPVVAFAKSTREAMTGRVHELPETGGPELAEAARAFNATLRDLHDLRKRLVVTERIAARREVARQVAHEIKNPLSPIRTSLETLRKLHARGTPQFDEVFEETTNTMLNEVRRLTAMVGHFSEYARLPSPVPRPFDLRKLALDIVSFHEGLGATIVGDLKPLPEVLADRDQIAQVLTNLIKNALEATRRSPSPTVWVRLAGDETGSRQIVSVWDNGPGIPESHLDRLFEPYATTKAEGTGLGLPISHRIAVEHGGDLTYRKADTGGALFELTLPTQGPPELDPQP